MYSLRPEIVPECKLRPNLLKEGIAYDLLPEDVTDPKCGYSVVSDAWGLIQQSKAIDCAL
jgi:hypothetical protein